MTESPESKMGKAALGDAAGVDHPDAGVRGFQSIGNGAAGAAGGLGIVGVVLLFAALIPFIGYYALFLDTFTTVGFDVARYQRIKMLVNVDATGVFFDNRFGDAVFLFIGIAVLFFVLAPRIGYFLVVGVILVPLLGGRNANWAEVSLILPALLYIGGWLLGYPKFVLPVWASCLVLAAVASGLLALSPVFGPAWTTAGTAGVFVLAFMAFSTLSWAASKGFGKLRART